MKTLGSLAACLTVLGLLCCAAPAMAHPMDEDFEFDSLAPQQVVHEDEDPWKGWFTATVTNTSNDAWGGFHFELIRNLGFGTPSLVVFDDLNTPFEIVGWAPGSYSYQISQDLLKVDFYFYGSPINPTDTATFKVYTDNTANQQFFGMLLYPTAVPEPSTLVLLVLAGLGLLVCRGRRRGD